MATDMIGTSLEVGCTVAAAFREGNVAHLRKGVVEKTSYGYEPNVTRTPDTEMVPIAHVRWTDTTGWFLPKKNTWMTAAKLLVVDNV